MADREKVIKGLEHCIDNADCDGCPYDVYTEGCDVMFRDALKVIRESIPVDWLREKMNSAYEPDSKAAWRVLRLYEKEGKRGENP